MKIGDAVLVPGDMGVPYEGVVVEFNRYGRTGTVCAYINWDGDGLYTDCLPSNMEVISVGEIRNRSIREKCFELRRKEYMKEKP